MSTKQSISTSYLITLYGQTKTEHLFNLAGVSDLITSERISYEILWDIVRAYLNESGDETHALSAVKTPPGSFEFLIGSMLQAQNLADGLERLTRASTVLSGGMSSRILHNNSRSGIAFNIESIQEPHRSLYIGLWVVVFQCALAWLSGRSIKVKLIYIPHKASALTKEALILLGAPIRHIGNEVVIWYDKQELQKKLSRDDIWLVEDRSYAEYLHMVNTLNKQEGFDSNSWREEILMLISDGVFNLDEASASLNASVAKTRRALSQEGTSFREILDEYRLKSFDRLTSSHMNQDDIAFELGYSDSRSLRRARKRWTLKKTTI